MATGFATTTTEAVYVPEKWSPEVLYTLYAKNVMRGKIETIDIPYGIDTIHYPIMGQLTAEEITEGTSLTGKNVTSTNQDLVIDQLWAVPSSISDRITKQHQSLPNVIQKYRQRQGEALAYKIDTLLLGLYASMSQEVVGTNLTLANILAAQTYIQQANGGDGKVWLIVTPAQYAQLLQIDIIAKAAYFGSADPIQRGKIFEIHGITVAVSNNIGANSSYYNNIMFDPGYAILGIQDDLTVESQYIVLDQATHVVSKILFGYREQRDGFAVRLPTTT